MESTMRLSTSKTIAKPADAASCVRKLVEDGVSLEGKRDAKNKWNCRRLAFDLSTSTPPFVFPKNSKLSPSPSPWRPSRRSGKSPRLWRRWRSAREKQEGKSDDDSFLFSREVGFFYFFRVFLFFFFKHCQRMISFSLSFNLRDSECPYSLISLREKRRKKMEWKGENK